MTYNSLAPAWNALGRTRMGRPSFIQSIADWKCARKQRRAAKLEPLLSQRHDGNVQSNIFSVAKYVTANASPGVSDVVLLSLISI